MHIMLDVPRDHPGRALQDAVTWKQLNDQLSARRRRRALSRIYHHSFIPWQRGMWVTLEVLATVRLPDSGLVQIWVIAISSEDSHA